MASLHSSVQTQSDHVKFVDKPSLSSFPHKNIIRVDLLYRSEPHVCHCVSRALEVGHNWFSCSLVVVLYHCVPVFCEPLLLCLPCLTMVLLLTWTGRSSLVTGDHVQQVGALK